MRVDCMVSVLGELGLLHALVALETEAFVSDWLSKKHSSTDGMTLAQVEQLVQQVVLYQDTHHLPPEERKLRFPQVHELVDISAGTTPLLQAVRQNDLELVHLLLRFGALPDEASFDGMTPLFAAAQKGHADAVRA